MGRRIFIYAVTAALFVSFSMTIEAVDQITINAEPRKWTSRDGKWEMTATLHSVPTQASVRLKKGDGTLVDIEYASICLEDRLYVMSKAGLQMKTAPFVKSSPAGAPKYAPPGMLFDGKPIEENPSAMRFHGFTPRKPYPGDFSNPESLTVDFDRVETAEKAKRLLDYDGKPLPSRKWIDVSGKFNVDASLYTIASGKLVVLSRADETRINVPYDRLSEDDKRYVADNANIIDGLLIDRKSIKGIAFTMLTVGTVGKLHYFSVPGNTPIELDGEDVAVELLYPSFMTRVHFRFDEDGEKFPTRIFATRLEATKKFWKKQDWCTKTSGDVVGTVTNLSPDQSITLDIGGTKKVFSLYDLTPECLEVVCKAYPVQAKAIRLAATPRRAAEVALGLAVDKEITLDYSYKYQGLVVSGVSKFVFNAVPLDIDYQTDRVKLELKGIQRYWNGEVREKNISMPFKDPGNFYVYSTPPNWGERAKTGDTAWIDLKTLKSGQDNPGEVISTGKGESIGLAILGTAIIAGKLGEAIASSSGTNLNDTGGRWHYEERLLVCKKCRGRGTYFGPTCSECNGSRFHNYKVKVPD